MCIIQTFPRIRYIVITYIKIYRKNIAIRYYLIVYFPDINRTNYKLYNNQ